MGVVATLVAMAAVSGPAAPSRAQNDFLVATSCTIDDPFTTALSAQLASRWPGQRFTAAVYDQRTGCQFVLNPGLSITTASVVKVELMAGVLLRAQREGRALTPFEQSRIQPMISQSANAPASELFNYLGGTPGMAALNQELGLGATSAAPSVWGLTSTTARDQVWLLRQLLLGPVGPFSDSSRFQAWLFMSGVVPEQRWGITAGVPGGWSVPQKNGFADSACCGWRINSVGVAQDPSGRGRYAVAILSDRWPSQAAGIEGVEHVARAVSAALAHPLVPPTVYQRDSLTPGVADRSFAYGDTQDQIVVGDWNGDGIDSPSAFRTGTWYLRQTNDTGAGDSSFGFGSPGDAAVAGDWDGDGIDSPGLYRNGVFHLRNTLDTGAADITVAFGQIGDIPVVGDWNGDALDTVGVYRDGVFYTRDANTTGVAERMVPFGDLGDRVPAVGDWDGDGTDTVGIYRKGVFHLRQTNTPGRADLVIPFGSPADRPLPGDWNDDLIDTLGVTRARL